MTIAINTIDPTEIGTYADLLSMIPLWMDRDDLDSQVPKFIALIEPTLNRRLRTLSMEVNALWSVGPVPYDLPNDYRALRNLWVEGDPDRPLIPVTPTQIGGSVASTGGAELVIDGDLYVIDDGADSYEPGDGRNGQALYYYTLNRTLILLPPPADVINLRALYYSRIPALTPASQTNWLLAEHPDVYVWGALKQASIYIRDPEAASACEAMFEEAVGEVITASRRDRYGAAPLIPTIIRQPVGGVRC